MTSPLPMAKIRLAGPKHLMREAVDALYDAKILHIEEFPKEDFFRGGNQFEDAPFFSEQLVKTSSLISALRIKGEGTEITAAAAAAQKLSHLESEYSKLSQEALRLREEIKASEQKEMLLAPIEVLGIDTKLLSGYKSLFVFKGTVKKDFEEALKKATANYELFSKGPEKRHPKDGALERPAFRQGKRMVFALFVPLELKEKAAAVLAKHGFEPFGEPPAESMAELRAKKEVAARALSKTEAALEKMKSENSKFLLDYECCLAKNSLKADAPLRFAASATAFVAYGWVPKAQLEPFRRLLEKRLRNAVFLETFDDAKGAPVALNNPKFIKPFEFFMNLYTLPRYAELDPTTLVFLTFPLFFGFMLGDVGYGIATLAIAGVLRMLAKKGMLRELMSVMLISSLATIAFGFVFGEFFGMEFLEHPLLNRVHDINTMLLVAISVGVIHVNLGIILGFYNMLKQHGFMHALTEKACWFVLEAGVALLAVDFMKIAPIGIIPGVAAIIAALALLYKGEGAMGFIEIPALLSNILSYARLFAIGLASVELALIINQFAGTFMEMGGIFIAGAIALLVFGHFLNLLIGIMGSFLHSLRLHYVEFFTKFFEGGGKAYAPFGEAR